MSCEYIFNTVSSVKNSAIYLTLCKSRVRIKSLILFNLVPHFRFRRHTCCEHVFKHSVSRQYFPYLLCKRQIKCRNIDLFCATSDP